MTGWGTFLIAIYGAILSTVAVFINIRSHFNSGARVILHVKQGEEVFMGQMGPNKIYTTLKVLNIGRGMTTINQFGTISYKNFFFKLIRYSCEHTYAVSNIPDFRTPYELKGGGQWRAVIPEDNDFFEVVEKYRTYVYVQHTNGFVMRRVVISKSKPRNTGKPQGEESSS